MTAQERARGQVRMYREAGEGRCACTGMRAGAGRQGVKGMARIYEFMHIFWRFGIFCCQYGFSKCVKTAFCGLLVMGPLLIWHYWRREKSGRCGDGGFYSWFLLFPAAATGMSRLFYQRWSIWLQNGINVLGRTWISGACFAVMLMLVGWWLVRKRTLARKIRKLPCWYSINSVLYRGREDWRDCVSRVTCGDRWKLARWYLGRARVYIGKDGTSPFCGGIFRPYIVMPDFCLEPAEEDMNDWEDRRLTKQGKVLLCHELLHLKAGHILWINLFALLRIYWWFNPLVYLCERLLQQDMEKACDEGCLYYADVSEREYGRMLLAMAAGQTPMRPAGAATFLKDRDYHSLKSRICNLKGKCEWKQYQCIHKRMGQRCAVTLALGFLAVEATSYPLYTRLPELTLYDESLRLICNDSPQLREAVAVVDGYLRIDGERMEECIKDLEIEGEYVYLGYDAIMKVPGAGGGGNVGMIALGNYEDIFYLRAESWENDFMEFCLKYLL